MTTPPLDLNDWTRLVATEDAVLGADFGLGGALAALKSNGELLAIMDMPVLADGTKGGRTINAPLVAEIIARSHAKILFGESVSARPGEGAVGAHAFRRGVGIIIGAAAALNVSVRLISPAQIRRAVGLPTGNGKDASRSEAIRRCPQHASLFARARDNARSGLFFDCALQEFC